MKRIQRFVFILLMALAVEPSVALAKSKTKIATIQRTQMALMEISIYQHTGRIVFIPFDTRIRDISLLFEACRFTSGDHCEEIKPGELMQRGIYVLRNNDDKEKMLHLNPVDGNKFKIAPLKLSYDEISHLMNLANNMSDEKNYRWFHENLEGADFYLIAFLTKNTKARLEKISLSHLKQTYVDASSELIGVIDGRDSNYIITDGNFHLPYDAYDDLDSFYLENLLIDNTVNIQWNEKENYSHLVMLTQPKKSLESDEERSREPTLTQKANTIVQSIAKQMIRDGNITKACLEQENSHLSRTISVSLFYSKSQDEGIYLVRGNSGECCGGLKRCNSWLYKQTSEGRYLQLLNTGPIDDVEVAREDTESGYPDLRLSFPGGYAYPPTEEYYQYSIDSYVRVR